MSIQPLLDPNNINNKSAIYYGFDITTDKILTKTGDNAGYVNYKMPDLGSVGDIIQTDGSGNLFFSAAPTPPGSGIVYTGTLPLATGTHLKSNNPLGTTVNESIMIETANDISLQNGTISNCGGITMTGTIAIGTNDITGTTGLIQGFNIPTLNTTANTALSTANTAQSTANSAQSTANTALTTANNALPLSGGTMTGDIDMDGKNIQLVNDIFANHFTVFGGTNIQYMLADGSLLTSSANSGNSNFYLYKSIDNATTPPIGSGNVVYNNAIQSLATVIYISHLTRDNVDIEIFFENVSSLNDLYIQDQNNSLNFIRYNITGTPTIIPNDYILIPVILGTSGGTGSTSFGTNHNVLLSIFTNSIETDVRISNLETKTQNQTAIVNTTTFAGSLACSGLDMNTTKITNLATPTLTTDATNKSYVDSLIVAPTTISSVGTGISILGSGIAPNYTTKSISVSGTGISTSTSTATDLVITSTALPTTGGTMTGSIAMGTNKITNLGTPTLTTDATNKSYVDSLIVAPTTISSVGTGLSLLGSGLAPNYTTRSLNVIGGGLSLGNSTSTDLVITSTALPTTGGTMTGSIAMTTNKITSTYIPIANDDLTNKLYIDSAINAIKQKGYPFNPLSNGTVAIPTSSKSYFYTIIINRPLTISGFSVWLGGGSDNIRVGIFRGFVKASPISTATLVGQSGIIAATSSLPYTTGTITAVALQNLSFASGEYMTLGFSSNGTTNSFFTSPTTTPPANSDIAFNGPVNYVNLGFTSILQSTQQTSPLIYKVCMELS